MQIAAGAAFALVQGKRPGVSKRKFEDQFRLWGELGYSLEGSTVAHAELDKRYSIRRLAKMRAAASGEVQTVWPAHAAPPVARHAAADDALQPRLSTRPRRASVRSRQPRNVA